MKDRQAIRASWDRQSDDHYQRQYGDAGAIERLKKDPWLGFPSRVGRAIREHFPVLRGMRVCVPSSGDNVAAFAFHLLGASVTSCDLSGEQIKNARKIAAAQEWELAFSIADSMALEGIENGAYDLVYTSNGVHVWISDLCAMYGSFRRVLKAGGRYIFFETHPFIRPFDDSSNALRVIKPYEKTGPFGDPPNYLWRICDFANGLISSGFRIVNMDEFHAEKAIIGARWWDLDGWDAKADWHVNPYAALPQWVSFCAVK